MSDEGSSDDKPFEPTQRRLDEARKRGEIVRSADLTAAAAMAGFVLAIVTSGEMILMKTAGIGQSLLARADLVSSAFAANGRASLGPVLWAVGMTTLPLFLFPFVAVMVGLVAQRALLFSPEKLMPRLSRVSPLSTARQKFGTDGLFSFVKSTIKMCIIAAIFVAHLTYRSDAVVGSLNLSPGLSITLMMRLLVEFLVLVLLIGLVAGGVDYIWQRGQHLQRNRMSYQEMMDEVKEGEGDPNAKAKRRQRGQEIALNRMLQDVEKADVVIVNPTHFAVALRWKRGDRNAPLCVAKGVDEIAGRIRERAILSGVPIHPDPPTARAIYAAVDVGEPILPAHYKPVAAAIRFSEALKKRKRGLK
jgi:flagellar biosynthetic protein FlhB